MLAEGYARAKRMVKPRRVSRSILDGVKGADMYRLHLARCGDDGLAERNDRVVGRYCVVVTPSIDFTIAFDEPDEDGWIVARVLEVPGALSQGRTREEARENVLDALRTVLTPDDELRGQRSGGNLEHLRFVAAA